MTLQVEGMQTRPVDNTAEIMAAVTDSEKDFATRDGEITPSGGVVKSEGLWAPTATPESQIANHVEDVPAVVESTPEAVVVPASEPLAVEPIKTESVSMGDSVFTQKETPIESTPSTQNEAFGVDVTQDFPPAEGVIKEREENPSRLPGKQMPEFHEELGAELEAGMAKADEKLDNRLEAVEEDAQLPNPEERFEAHFAEIRKDLAEMNESLDNQTTEAQKEFEAKTAQAEILAAEAEDLRKQSEAKQMEAYNLQTAAQNNKEKVQGEVSGRKARIAEASERLDSLQF